jgi:hypothetical protein
VPLRQEITLRNFERLNVLNSCVVGRSHDHVLLWQGKFKVNSLTDGIELEITRHYAMLSRAILGTYILLIAIVLPPGTTCKDMLHRENVQIVSGFPPSFR